MRRAISFGLVSLFIVSAPAQAATFSGGMCASKGVWLAEALKQSRVIVDALNTLRNDPNCKLLSDTLEKMPKGASGPAASDTSYANIFRELSALSDFINPARAGSGLTDPQFQSAVLNVMFNKSYKGIKDLNNNMSAQSKADVPNGIQNVSEQLKNFLDHSSQIADVAMSTTQNLLAVLPQSESCLHNKPSTKAAIFGAVAHATAALVTGGQMSNVGSFASSLINYSRDMKYVKSLKPIELDEFNNSVYCLVESTSEAYCAVQDTEDSLAMLKNAGGRRGFNLNALLKQGASDPIASPLAGLMIYMREIPVIQGWLEKVLLGLEPRTSWQGDSKINNWEAFVGFIKSTTKLRADFKDKEQQYYDSTGGKDNAAKFSQIRKMYDGIMRTVTEGGGDDGNFYLQTRTQIQIAFFLVGMPVPTDFNDKTTSFSNYWNTWSRDGTGSFSTPEHLLTTIHDQLGELINNAQSQANALFASRMLVDPQVLVTNAMSGPGISAYQAFYDQRMYYANLITKLDRGAAELEAGSHDQLHARQLRSSIPLLRDTVERLDKVIESLNAVAAIRNGDSSMAKQSEKLMNVIYEAGNMLVSWDSFFGTRMQSALQADLSDTLWRKAPMTEMQRQYLMSVGPDIVQRLSGAFATDPVTDRVDLNAAKIIHVNNLKAVEEQFAKVLFTQILDLDCKLEGGYACSMKDAGFDPSAISSMKSRDLVDANIHLLESHQSFRRTHSAGNEGKKDKPNAFDRLRNWFSPKPTEDAEAFVQTRAKLCMQALAFNSRDLFQAACADAMLESEFATKENDPYQLNMSFDAQLASIKKQGKMDSVRTTGVCSYRSYLRKNHVFYMYRDFNDDNGRPQ